MKKTYFILAAAFLFSLGLASCKKDQSVMEFTASIERNGVKTSVENLDNFSINHDVHWVVDDEVMIWGNSDNYALGHVFKAQNGGSAQTTLHSDSHDGDIDHMEGSDAFRAGYPAEMWHHSTQIEIPVNQEYKYNNVTHFPMYAVSSSNRLEFKNLCGILRLKMPDVEGKSVAEIEVHASGQVAGVFDVSWINGTPTLGTNGGSPSNDVYLNFPTPVELQNDQCFYVPIPQQDLTFLEVVFHATDGSKSYIKFVNADHPGQVIEIRRSQVTTIDVSQINPPTGPSWEEEPTTRDYFSVSPTLKVDISRGNLLYSNSTYRFATSQWYVDYGESDLHPWSDNLGTCMGTDDNTPDSPWRMLSKTEWDYLMHERENALSLRTFVEITDMYYPDGHQWNNWSDAEQDYIDIPTPRMAGLLIFPDNFIPTNTTDHNYVSLNFSDVTTVAGDHFYYNELTQEQVEHFINAHHAVFIPAAGSELWGLLNMGHPTGVYWTNTYWGDDEYGEYNFSSSFYPTFVDYDYGYGNVNPYEHFGMFWHDHIAKPNEWNADRIAVRLVRNAMTKNNGTWSYKQGL